MKEKCDCQNLEKRILVLEKEVMHLKKAFQYQLKKSKGRNSQLF